MYVGVLSTYMSVHYLCVLCLQRPEECVGSPGIDISDKLLAIILVLGI